MKLGTELRSPRLENLRLRKPPQDRCPFGQKYPIIATVPCSDPCDGRITFFRERMTSNRATLILPAVSIEVIAPAEVPGV